MPNLRAKFINSEPLPEGIYRPLCWHYDLERRICEQRASVKVTIRITYENCCLKPPGCACGYYAEMKLCETHALEYAGKERDGIAS